MRSRATASRRFQQGSSLENSDQLLALLAVEMIVLRIAVVVCVNRPAG